MAKKSIKIFSFFTKEIEIEETKDTKILSIIKTNDIKCLKGRIENQNQKIEEYMYNIMIDRIHRKYSPNMIKKFNEYIFYVFYQS